jgi:hypothetical protein
LKKRVEKSQLYALGHPLSRVSSIRVMTSITPQHLLALASFFLLSQVASASPTSNSTYDAIERLYEDSLNADSQDKDKLCASRWNRYELIGKTTIRDFPFLGFFSLAEAIFAEPRRNRQSGESFCDTASAPALFIPFSEERYPYSFIAGNEKITHSKDERVLTAIGTPDLSRKQRRRLGLSRNQARLLRSKVTCVTATKADLLICKHEPDSLLETPPYFITFFRKGEH